MSTHTTGESEITANGQTWRFKVGMGALIQAQEQVGRDSDGRVPTFDELLVGIQQMRLLYVRAFLWAGLRKYHAEMTLEAVEDLIDRCDAREVAALLLGLRQGTQPDPRDLAALEAAGARPTAAAATAPGPRQVVNGTSRAPGRGRSTSKRARPA